MSRTARSYIVLLVCSAGPTLRSVESNNASNLIEGCANRRGNMSSEQSFAKLCYPWSSFSLDAAVAAASAHELVDDHDAQTSLFRVRHWRE